MPVELKTHFVAFLDILGFSEMVRQDSEGSDQKFLSKLYKCHQNVLTIFASDVHCSITQFSDSVVVARPFSPDHFSDFIKQVAEYQRLLFDEGLLCRGGVAVNKHFSNGNFTFSAGLIDAYIVESKSARYPRVVISKELINLIFPEEKNIPSHLIREDDGLLFIDYIGITKTHRPVRLLDNMKQIVNGLISHGSSSVREKGIWLAAYSDFILGTSLTPNRFVTKPRKIIKKKG